MLWKWLSHGYIVSGGEHSEVAKDAKVAAEKDKDLFQEPNSERTYFSDIISFFLELADCCN